MQLKYPIREYVDSVVLKMWKYLPLSRKMQLRIMNIANDTFLIGVTGVIFNKQSEVLLFEHSYRDIEWSLPGGYLKAGEHPKEGLAREIYEESGFNVKIMKIIKTDHDAEGARLDMIYFGEYESGTFQKSNEVSSYGFFPLHSLPKLIPNQYRQINEGYKRFHAQKKLHPFLLIQQKLNFFLQQILNVFKLKVKM